MQCLIVIPGFGSPNLDHKKELYYHNISIIAKSAPDMIFDIQIYNYDCVRYGLDSIKNTDNIRDVSENLIKGVIGEFIYKYVKPASVSKYDYIIMMVDDILIEDTFDLTYCLKNYHHYKFDIVSPSLSRNSPRYSHYIMIQRHEKKIRQQNMLEYFLYIMSKEAYTKYYNLLDENTTWLWGIDCILHKNNISTAVFDFYTMTHYYNNRIHYKSCPIPGKELAYNKKKYNLQSIYDHVIFNYLDPV